MAKTRFVDAPPKNDVYTGMIGVTAACMFVGIVLLVIECTGYDWAAKSVAGPAINLPKIDGGAPTTARPGTPTPPANPQPAPMTVAPRVEPAPLPVVPPTAVAVTPPVIAPLPAPLPVKIPVAEPTPVVPLANPPVDRGPRPGFGPLVR